MVLRCYGFKQAIEHQFRLRCVASCNPFYVCLRFGEDKQPLPDRLSDILVGTAAQQHPHLLWVWPAMAGRASDLSSSWSEKDPKLEHTPWQPPAEIPYCSKATRFFRHLKTRPGGSPFSKATVSPGKGLEGTIQEFFETATGRTLGIRWCLPGIVPPNLKPVANNQVFAENGY